MRLLSTVLAMLLIFASSACADKLYQGEKRFDVDGYPAVERYIPGDPSKPLVVFSTGAHHTARVSYGGHEGARAEDFLAYWLNKLGYNFLAVSYPIATESGFMGSPPAPDFTARVWGRQIAEAAKAEIANNKLSGHVVILGWSMSGKVLQPAFKAASEAGLTVDGEISLVATPGTIGLSPETQLKMAPSGYADRKDMYVRWLAQLKENNRNNGGREIIPEKIYTTEYVGDIPVALEGFGEVYRNGKFEMDSLLQARDYGAFDFANYPLIAVVTDTSPLDAEHALVDRYWWGFYNAETIFNTIKRSGTDPAKLSGEKLKSVIDLTAKINSELVLPVDGNHFFYVGERGASRAANAIDTAIKRLAQFKKELGDLK
jgi:hypothetical protein